MDTNAIRNNRMSGCQIWSKEGAANASSQTAGFMEAIAEKASQDRDNYDEKAFASVGANAPEEVKQAWMEAAKETGANGLGMSGNGKLTHLSQMMAEQMKNRINGAGGTNGLLGSTVQSAIRAAEQALYDLDNLGSLGSTKSLEVQRRQEKERAFYQSFLKKLGAQKDLMEKCIETKVYAQKM